MTRSSQIILLIVLAGFGPFIPASADSFRLNMRKSIDSSSSNLVIKARIEAMLAGERVRSMTDRVGTRSENDCSIDIGSGSSLLELDKPIIIVGPIINLCQ